MTFSAEKEKPNSERAMLVKITPSRFVNDDLANILGLYTMAFSEHIDRIERNGVELTRVTGIPANNDEWSTDTAVWINTYDIVIKLAAAPSTGNVIVVYYNLFYTSGQYRITTVDPEDDATDEIHWEPRLEEEPAVKQSARDIINGTLSIALTTIRLINSDNKFQSYFTDADSFYEKTVKCWMTINGTSNIQKVYEGRVKKVSLDNKAMTLTTYDMFSLLDQPALMGDETSECYWGRSADSFPDADPTKAGTPIKLMLGKTTRFKTQGSNYINNGAHLDLDACEQAVCTSWSSDVTTSNNRTWGLCRVLSEGVIKPSVFPTVTSQVDLDQLSMFRVSNTDYADMDIEIGDCYKITEGATTHYGFVSRINSSGVGTDIYFYTDASSTPAFTTAATLTPLYGAFVLRNLDGSRLDLFEDRDFTFSQTSLASGNKYVSITFDNNFESTVTGIDILDPGTHRLCYRLRLDSTSMRHGEVMKVLSERAGLDTEADSFTAATTALPVNTAFSIPMFDESDFNTYRKYAEEICKSTMGILYANNSFKLAYKLIDAPSSSDAITEDLYLKNSMSISVDYQDIVTQLVAYNPHNSSQEAIDAVDSPSATVSSTVAEFLHGIKRTTRFRHVLETITDRIQDIFDILSHRRAIYTFKTATENLDSEIGDDLQLESDQVLGGLGTRDLKIISIDKSADEVVVEATDLLDI